MAKPRKKRLVLIDGNNLAYRAFYALPDTITTSSGVETNAVFGFSSMLLKLLEDTDPDDMVCALDSSGPTFRHKIFDEYKANRKEMPQSLVNQMDLIKEVLETFDVTVLEKEGYEADDIIATITNRLADKYDEVIIASSDKDILQLVGDNVRVMASRKGITDTIIFDGRRIEKKFGVLPKNIKDYLSLVGDSSDNIPGVPGIGPKTAVKLIGKHGSIENIYGSLQEEDSKRVKNLLEKNRDSAFKSRELIELKNIEDLELGMISKEKKSLDLKKIDDLFNSLEFSSLKKRFTEASLALKYFEGVESHDKDSPRRKLDITMLESEDEIVSTLQKGAVNRSFYIGLLDQRYFEGKTIVPGDVRAVIFKDESHRTCVVNTEIINKEKVKAAFKNVLQDKDIDKIGFDLKSVFRFFYDLSIKVQGKFIDFKVIYLLLNPYKTNAGIIEVIDNTLKRNILGLRLSEEQKRPQKKQMTLDFAECDKSLDKKEITERYDCLLRSFGLFNDLKGPLLEKLEKEGADDLYFDIEGPLIMILAEMEAKGVSIDTDYLKKMIIEYEQDIKKLTEDIYRLSGSKFNINSPQQLSEVLFQRLGLPVIKKTKTGFSTNAATLMALSGSHPVIEKILDYREKVKLKNTYLDVLPKLLDKKDRRVHTSYNQLGTTTGRISSSDPNLQNIPVRTDLGKQIRKAFIPGEGYDLLLSADYSQIELRVLAHMSMDKNLIESFNKGKDIHTSTAAEIFDIGYEEVDEEHRRKAKAINFGIIYGMTEYGLKNRLKITEQEARDYIELYFSRYPDVSKYLNSLVMSAKENGFARTIFGRKRYIKELSSSNYNLRNLGERLAINTPIQGSAADIMKLSTIDLYNNLQKKGIDSNIVLHVHDEIVLELKSDDLEVIKKIVKKSLENCIRLEVKLKVDLKIGSNWYI